MKKHWFLYIFMLLMVGEVQAHPCFWVLPSANREEPNLQKDDSTGWQVPSKKVVEKVTPAKVSTSTEMFLAGAVPEVNGKVIFTFKQAYPSRSAKEIYNRMYQWLDSVSTSARQLPESGIVLFNKNENVIVAKLKEWMTFSKSALSVDRTIFNYSLIVHCADGELQVSMERLSYDYERHRETGFSSIAERLITDEFALNKKKTKLNKITGKFRRGTILRKNELFEQLKHLF